MAIWPISRFHEVILKYMNGKKRAVWAILLLIISVCIHLYSLDSMRVESGYSHQFFASFSRILRLSLGWIPFSIGDFLYGIFIGWFIWQGYRLIRRLLKIRKRPVSWTVMRSVLLNIFIFCCSLYIIFNLFWGINYNRMGIAWQLGLKMEKYSTADLQNMNALLVEKVNQSKAVLVKNKAAYPGYREMFTKVSEAYTALSRTYPFIKYEPASLKSSMWGWLGNYTGFTGYYNPFTGEGQVNTSVPKFLQPFIACHEVAHQVGYAKEMEANFVGYLAASRSPDTLLHYSVYLDLFTYANRNLFFTDSTSANRYRKQLLPAVVDDYKEWIRFNRNHQSIAEPVIRWLYGKFLQGNKQPQGIMSYDEVTSFLISYYKKFGMI
jgi:hypothetical protein